MTDKKHDYDPDLPYVVVYVATGRICSRHAEKRDALDNVTVGRRLIDTTPAPRVPEDAKFITWRVQGNDRWYAEREGDAWCTDDGELFGAVEDLPDVTPDTVFTVLEERKS